MMKDICDLQQLLLTVELIDQDAMPETVFGNIADGLFRRWLIRKGDVTFRFLEIEFYYLSPHHPDYKTDPKSGAKRPFVYSRNSEAGDFFLHNSGVDICFRSSMTKDGAKLTMQKGGGILLRSLLRTAPDERDTAVMGPIACREALFNYSNSRSSPVIEETEEPFDDVALKSALRMRGNTTIDLDRKYCFYDASKYDTATNNWISLYPRFDPILRHITHLPYSPRLNERSK